LSHKSDLLWLALGGLALLLFARAFQSAPGYMDADYYALGGWNLARGAGFNENIAWNYLSPPAALPQPSHAYWMPLASLVAALGLLGAPHFDFARASLPFVLIAASLPPLTYALAWKLTQRRALAVVSGLLAMFSGYYLPVLTTTDTFGLYALFGGLFFLGFDLSHPRWRAVIWGLLAALMHLARADGLLWLGLAGLVALLYRPTSAPRSVFARLLDSFLVLIAYLALMLAWFARNLSVFGTPLAPGGSRALWLTSYDQMFSYPPDALSLQSWLDSGWQAILSARLWALGLNLQTTLGVQGMVFLLPFIIVGLWHLRGDVRLRLMLLGWGLTLFAMSIVFPFAGARGGYFHSGAAFQPLFWAVAPLGLEQTLKWLHARRKVTHHAFPVFRFGLVLLAIIVSAFLFNARILPGTDAAFARYRVVETYLSGDAPILLANPPGYHLATGRAALAIPNNAPSTLALLAQTYGARYALLEQGSAPAPLQPLFDDPAGFSVLAQTDEWLLIEIAP
jgi:hypothetical protein